MNFRAIHTFGVPINYMIRIVRDEQPGWLTALRDAVRVDPSALGCKTISNRLAIARLTNDERATNAVLNTLRSPKVKKKDAWIFSPQR